MLSIRPLPGPFQAVEIDGLSPQRDASDEPRRAQVRAALARHGVLCVRLPAALDDADMCALASMIGPIKDPVGCGSDGSALRYGEDRQIIDSGFVLSEELRACERFYEVADAGRGRAPRRMKWLVGWRRLSGGTEVVVPSGVEQPAVKFDREPCEPPGLSPRVRTWEHVSQTSTYRLHAAAAAVQR
jgi:hypothetical protein